MPETKPISRQETLSSELRGMLEALPGAVMVVDATGGLLFANESLARRRPDRAALTGRQFEEAFPDYASALRGDPPWLSPQEVEISRAGTEGEIHERLFVRCVQDCGYLFVLDETRLHEAERERARTARLASIGFMVAGVCHEVSNPLASTYSMVQLLQQQDELSEEALRRGLDNIATNVKRILDITRRVTDFSRAGEGMRAPLAIDHALDEALALLRQDRQFETMAVEQDRGPNAVVRGDLGQLRQVFYNIFLNAWQAMGGSGQLVIRTARVNRERVRVRIDDTGPGIPEEYLQRIFDPFFTTKRRGEGTGLGLAICRDIIHEHHGTIAVHNKSSGGTRFELEFPAEVEGYE